MNSNVRAADPIGALLSVEDLKVEYTSDGEIVHAVNGVSFSIRQGETLGLVGETGAGKTTIAKAILRVLPDFSTKAVTGSILFDQKDILRLPEKQMQKLRGGKVSMIFQDPMTALNPLISVGKQIAEAVALHSDISKQEAVERACEMLETVGITRERYGDYPHQFSGGMKQRVVIAMALACKPVLLLADEPTTALDVTIQAQVLELINKLKEELHTAMLLITHDLGIIAETCDKVAVIYAGRIIESGTKRDIFKNPSHPYTKGLFDSIPHLDSKERRLSPIPGLPPDPTALPQGCCFAPRCPHAAEACRQGSIDAKEISTGHFCACLRAGE